MSRRKNKTDQPFRDQLRHYEAAPPDQVWHGIASALLSDKRKKQVFWVSRIAASIAVLLVLGTTWFLLREPPETQIATREIQEEGTYNETDKSKTIVPDDKPVITDNEIVVPEISRRINDRTTDTEMILRETELIPAGANDAEYAVLVPAEQPFKDQLKIVPPKSAKGIQTG